MFGTILKNNEALERLEVGSMGISQSVVITHLSASLKGPNRVEHAVISTARHPTTFTRMLGQTSQVGSSHGRRKEQQECLEKRRNNTFDDDHDKGEKAPRRRKT